MHTPTEYEAWYRQVATLGNEAEDDLSGTAATARTIAMGVEASSLTDEQKSALLFMCSSVIINCGSELGESALLSAGKEVARQAESRTTPDQPLHYQCRYNVANAVCGLCDLGLPLADRREVWEPQLIQNRIERRDELQEARRTFFEVGSSTIADPRTRSAAYCNLGNMLDHSGRWAEAYDFYLRALEADPRNGNAAGNLAQLLRTRIDTGIGQTGHIAAVYNKYVALAQDLLEGTLEFASARGAERWDQLEPTDSAGHLSHGLEDLDAINGEYRRWVAHHRLALSPAVEGLGTEDIRWDSAAIEVLYGASPEEMNPPILGAMNVLKSDFLVSRRLAFEGVAQVIAGPQQADEDSGSYVETLDYSLYGIQYSKLLLAQRSALDVLDKTAVVANEHFGVGDVPSKVAFRKFWKTKTGELRGTLVKAPGRALPNLALAELAMDMDKTGMYAASQALRNAGTHRMVHAAVASATGVTQDSRSRIDLPELLDSATLALQVTRSAFLYLIDLFTMWNHPEDHKGAYLPFPGLRRYFNDSTADGANVDEGVPQSGGGPGNSFL